jgi:aryl-alcohol dehydrogenase-like predicted oxidoreductase
MVTRKLGRSNLEVTPLCLGTNVFGRTIDEQTAFAVLDAYPRARAKTPALETWG